MRTPFPYVERAVIEFRPALIISRPLDTLTGPLHFAIMITSAAHRRWHDDISLEDDHAVFGLPRPSVIRLAKVASVAMNGATLLGRLHGAKLAAVYEALGAATGLTPPA